jgi:hypothetical protein
VNSVIVFRCTRPLAKQLRVELAEPSEMSTGVLGDWYATRLNVGSLRLVLCLSERSLLPVLMPARRREFPDRFPDHLAPLLEFLGIPAGLIERETDSSKDAVFAPTRSKRILGSLNDFGQSARFMIRDSPNCCSPVEANLKLIEMPCKPIDYSFPGEVVRSLFEVAGRA